MIGRLRIGQFLIRISSPGMSELSTKWALPAVIRKMKIITVVISAPIEADAIRCGPRAELSRPPDRRSNRCNGVAAISIATVEGEQYRTRSIRGIMTGVHPVTDTRLASLCAPPRLDMRRSYTSRKQSRRGRSYAVNLSSLK